MYLCKEKLFMVRILRNEGMRIKEAGKRKVRNRKKEDKIKQRKRKRVVG